MSTSAPPPLLNYVYTSTPNPLQVSTNGAITVVASNPPPGTYAPADAVYPNNGYVAVSTLVFDFGPAGSGQSDLCPGDASTWTVTPPAGWSAPAVNGLQLTFTAPASGAVSPSDNLSFIFSAIPVNATIGVFSLTITETAYTPGDPENSTDYPAIPSQPAAPASPVYQTGSVGFAIGKFPQGFSPSFSASPVNVEAGSSTTLSWSGLPVGCNPSLCYGTSTLSLHADGTLFQPTDTYPDIARTPPDPLFALEAATIFTLLDDATPPYSSQVVVGVNYPNPVIQNFTVIPDIIITPVAPLAVTLTWAVANGAGDAPVTFTITPPLTSAESADNFFNTAHTASGSTTVNLIVPHQITLNVAGQPGATPATQTISFGPPQPVNVLSGSVDSPLAVACLPDGSAAFMTSADSSTLYLVSTSAADPTQWSATSSAAILQVAPNSLAVAAPSAGYGPFALTTAALSPYFAATSFNPSTQIWTSAQVSIPAGWAFFTCIGASSDGNHVLAGMMGPLDSSSASPAGVAIYSVNSATPSSWPVTCLTLPDNAEVFSFAAAPNGAWVCALGCITSSGTSNWTLWVITPSTGTLSATLFLYATGSWLSNSLNLAISPDGSFGILCAPPIGLRTIDLSSSDPTQWTMSAADPSYTPSSCAFSTDGSVAVLVNNAAGVTVVGPTASTAPSSWPAVPLTSGIGLNPQSVAVLPGANVALIPCLGSTASNGSLTVIPLP